VPFSFAGIVVALSLALVGCGGASKPVGVSTAQKAPSSASTSAAPAARTHALGKAAYDAKMRMVGRRFSVSVEGLYPLVEAPRGSEANRETVAKLKRTHAVIASLVATVGTIEPPTSIRAAHGRLLEGLKDFGDELDQLMAVVERGNYGSKPLSTYVRFPGLITIGQARAAIEKKGYAIG
jgi:hypothetical protein